jgi:hypothetical protein
MEKSVWAQIERGGKMKGRGKSRLKAEKHKKIMIKVNT